MAGTDSPDALEPWLERLFDSLDVGVIRIEHATGRVTRANAAYTRMFGFASVEEALRTPVIDHYADPNERKEIEARLLADESFRTTGVARIEVRRLRHDTREPIDVRLAVFATFGADGRVVQMDCTIEDVGEKKRAQRAFRASEERFRAIFEGGAVGVVVTDLGQTIQRVNRAFCEFLGRTEAELVGTDVRLYLHPEDLVARGGLEAQAGLPSAREVRFFRPGGVIAWGYATVSTLTDDDGAPHSIIGQVHDITDTKRHEQAMLRLAKLDSLGVLAGGIAHDFNNLLTAQFGYIELAQSRVPPDSEAHALLTEALSVFGRTKDLTQQLLTFAKGGAPQKRPGWVGDVVKEAAGFSLRGSNVAVELALPAAAWLAEFDPGQLNQVVHNLILNAQQAMPAGGTVRVEVSNEVLPAGSGLPLKAGRYVRIGAIDTGVGIPAENLERIFDPYFTTKETGSGLGLATSHSIVRRHGGHIAVASAVGKGTTFEVYLPVSGGVAPLAAGERVAEPADEAGTRVLVMDDEQSVRGDRRAHPPGQRARGRRRGPRRGGGGGLPGGASPGSPLPRGAARPHDSRRARRSRHALQAPRGGIRP